MTIREDLGADSYSLPRWYEDGYASTNGPDSTAASGHDAHAWDMEPE